MKIKSLIKVLFVFQPEKFGYTGQCSKNEYWSRIEPIIHSTYLELDTFKVSDELEGLKTWGEFYAEQIKNYLQD